MDDQQPADHSRNDAQLTEVKLRAIEALVPELNNLGDMPAQEQFKLVINAIRLTNNVQLFEVALQTVLSNEDPKLKAQQLVELIAEINYSEQHPQI